MKPHRKKNTRIRPIYDLELVGKRGGSGERGVGEGGGGEGRGRREVRGRRQICPGVGLLRNVGVGYENDQEGHEAWL